MTSKAQEYFASIRDKEVWFVGIGVAHTDTIRMFAKLGISVTACDKRSRDQIGSQLCHELEQLGVRLQLGEGYLDHLDRAEILLRTPGMYYNLPVLQRYREGGGTLTSEMELFCALCPCPLYAITGSDGKTTTTSIIGELLQAAGKRVHLGGNIGKAMLPMIFDIREEDVAVVELSSFQLISMHFSPAVSVVTNVTPNHLDVHGTMEEYIGTKTQVFLHQGPHSRSVLCADNDITASFVPLVKGECMRFSLKGPVERGAYYVQGDDTLYFVLPGSPPLPLLKAADIRLPGIHNVANYLAAVCAVWQENFDPPLIRQVAREFSGVEHRIEFVRELDGVKWYNDSIATSPTRVMAGLHAFNRKIILIAGGYDKQLPFEPLAPELIKWTKALVLTGPAADKIEAVVRNSAGYNEGSPVILRAADLAQAVQLARDTSQGGDIVSLSPACSSFDAYPNFEARGRHFKELVQAME